MISSVPVLQVSQGNVVRPKLTYAVIIHAKMASVLTNCSVVNAFVIQDGLVSFASSGVFLSVFTVCFPTSDIVFRCKLRG